MKITQKISVLFVLAILMLSVVPLAFADSSNGAANSNGANSNGVSNSNGEKTEEESATIVDDEAEETDSTELIDEDKEDEGSNGNAYGQEDDKEVPGNAYGLSNQEEGESPGNSEEGKDNFGQVRKEYAQAKADFLTKKTEIVELREQLTGCQASGGDCEEEKEEAKEASQEQLNNIVDLIQSSLEKIKERVEGSDLSEDEKEGLVEKIDESSENIAEAIDKLEALGDEATAAEVHDTVKDVKTTWGEIKPTFQWSITMIVNSQVEDMLSTVDITSALLEERITSLEEKGVDVTGLKEIFENFKGSLDSAKSANAKAKELAFTVENDEDVRNSLEEMRDYHTMAKESIAEAQEALRDLYTKMLQAEAGLADEEVVEESNGEDVDEDAAGVNVEAGSVEDQTPTENEELQDEATA
jgi:hypothetical protein